MPQHFVNLPGAATLPTRAVPADRPDHRRADRRVRDRRGARPGRDRQDVRGRGRPRTAAESCRARPVRLPDDRVHAGVPQQADHAAGRRRPADRADRGGAAAQPQPVPAHQHSHRPAIRAAPAGGDRRGAAAQQRLHRADPPPARPPAHPVRAAVRRRGRLLGGAVPGADAGLAGVPPAAVHPAGPARRPGADAPLPPGLQGRRATRCCWRSRMPTARACYATGRYSPTPRPACAARPGSSGSPRRSPATCTPSSAGASADRPGHLARPAGVRGGQRRGRPGRRPPHQRLRRPSRAPRGAAAHPRRRRRAHHRLGPAGRGGQTAARRPKGTRQRAVMGVRAGVAGRLRRHRPDRRPRPPAHPAPARRGRGRRRNGRRHLVAAVGHRHRPVHSRL